MWSDKPAYTNKTFFNFKIKLYLFYNDYETSAHTYIKHIYLHF